MSNLSENWITENLIDFEYKKYVLLGYLQKVKEHFKDQKLYPDLAELITHYKNLIQLKENTQQLENGFKKTIKTIDFKQLAFTYENSVNDELLYELKQVIDFSEPLLAREINDGKSIFDFAEKHISMQSIGIVPMYKDEGYFLLQPHQSKHVLVYNYVITKINLLHEQVYGLKCDFIKQCGLTISKTVDSIKLDMIDANPELPNPAVYYFKAQAEIPNEETFLPIAKRLLYKQLLAA